MNDIFTASNGIPVTCARDAQGVELLCTYEKDGTYPLTNARGDDVVALREFFRAEEDARLGRWRWPAHPHWVCYPTENKGEVVVFNEDMPQYGSQTLSRGDDTWPWYRAAANAYFDAHPEPKPAWHDAKPGEVWVLTIDGKESAFYPAKSMPGHFTPVAPNTGTTAFTFDWQLITDGRRIYPEPAV